MSRWVLCALVTVVAMPAAFFSGSAEAERSHVGYPNAIAVLGHSGATGFNSDPQRPDADVPANSWATGSNPDVRSLYLRILEANPAIGGHNANLARDGATISQVESQAWNATRLRPKPELVVIQILDNDIRCDGTDPANYGPFRKSFVTALTTLSRKLPNARIYVVSQAGRPARYAEVIKDIPEAWQQNAGTGPCDMFDAAGHIVPEHVAYLTQVIEAYEARLRTGCARFVHCHWDGGALSRFVDNRAYLSSDWNHPSITGHKAIAEQAWTGIFDFADGAAPASTASVSRRGRSRLVTLSSEAPDLAGIEYKVVPRKRSQGSVVYKRYSAPVRIKRGQTLVWRAVDVNGNTEATHSLRA